MLTALITQPDWDLIEMNNNQRSAKVASLVDTLLEKAEALATPENGSEGLADLETIARTIKTLTEIKFHGDLRG
jgi:hypothetical protein